MSDSSFSLLQRTCCGFIRAAVHKVSVKKPLVPLLISDAAELKAYEDNLRRVPLRERFNELEEYYNIPVDFKRFSSLLSKFKVKFSAWAKHNASEKKNFLETFSTQNWLKLDDAQRNQHTWANCTQCEKDFGQMQAIFPPMEKSNNSTAGDSNLAEREAKNLYENINVGFEQRHGMSFADGLLLNPDLQLSKQMSRKDKENMEKTVTKKVVREMEKSYLESSVER